MKNSMTITNNVVQQVTCADDGTNRLFINDTEIPSTDWVGSGSYTYGSITIDQIADLSGNIQLSEITATHYALVRTVTGSDISGDVVNTFDTYSTEYPDIEERDTVSTLFGKIKKFLADLKSKVNDKVSKSGDTMTGRLTVYTSNSDSPLHLRGNSTATYIGLYDNNNNNIGYLYGTNGNRAGYYYNNAQHHFAYLNEVVPLIAQAGIGSCSGGGKYSWFKIATLKVTDTYVNGPIAFEVSQRQYAVSLIQVCFASVNNSDPALSYFITDNDNHYYIKKTATSTWELYGQYLETWGGCSLHRILGFRVNNDVSVTVNMTNISYPGYDRQVAYGGNVAFAELSGSVNAGTSSVHLKGDSGTYVTNTSNVYNTIRAAAFTVSSSNRVKENIQNMSEEEAKKLLEVNVVDFDYIEQMGGMKNQHGVIAEDIIDILPSVVDIPKDYDEMSDDLMSVPSVDYSKFVPYLIKMVQIQQKELDVLRKEKTS